MDSRYDHLQFEPKMYQAWEKAQAFSPDRSLEGKSTKSGVSSKTSQKSTKSFSIIMPPPNANDPLHVGHAMFVAIEDTMIRFHRMLGDDTVWIPGTDHAGIETQFVFEKKLKKEGKSRFNFDRETLYKMIWQYVQENSGVAVDQMKKLGASADWERFMFTLNPQVVATVLKTFQKLADQKLVYRDVRLVNYCPHCGTAFSELEVKHQEQTSPLYYLKYGPFTIATVRPETKFRDTALAVNPKDPRYQQYIGQTLSIPGLLGPIQMTVIADEEVDMEFGTGIMKVTPAHDPHDFELGQRYHLPVTPIIDFNGRMDFSWYLNDPAHTDPQLRARAQKYHGLKVAKMREEMRQDLEAEGLLVKVDDKYVNTVGVCYRCGSVLEPLPLPQFFIKVKPLVKPVLEGLKKKDFVVYGAGHDKILKHWLLNLKDWNVSRQIVWGIRLPVWYDVTAHPEIEITFLYQGLRLKGKIGKFLEPTNHMYAEWPISGEGDPEVAKNLIENITTGKTKISLPEIAQGLQSLKAPVDAVFQISSTPPGDNFLQETDTFDTWFSSGQWPFATLQNTKPGDFARFYPTQVMETAYDILPFWVMRMLLLGYFATGQTPFQHIYFHGLIRDNKGLKMSKSKGNVVNPLEVVEKYGADALRLALIIRSTPGLDKSVGEPDFKAARNFTNKLWNAARYVQQLVTTDSQPVTQDKLDTEFDKKMSDLIDQVTHQLEDLKLGLAADTLYNEFWHWYCDQMIEAAKQNQLSPDQLLAGLKTFLLLLHPFIPFVTEAIWQEIKTLYPTDPETLLITATWPHAAQ